MPSILDLLSGVQPKPTTFLDIGLTALLIYWLFSLIRDTRAVRLVIGVTLLYGVYVLAQLLGLQLLSQILQAGAVVGLFALVVVFQPELRRALERLGHVGSLGWMLAPGQQGALEQIAGEISRAAAGFAQDRHGALIVLERETGLEDFAEGGVMMHADLTAELLRTIFMPRSPLHDGAVIVRGGRILSAGAVLPLAEVAPGSERYGTRHRAAFGITEETGAISLVERGRIVRNLDEEQLRVALVTLLHLDASLRAGDEGSERDHWPHLHRPSHGWSRGSSRRNAGRGGRTPGAAGAAAGRVDRP